MSKIWYLFSLFLTHLFFSTPFFFFFSSSFFLLIFFTSPSSSFFGVSFCMKVTCVLVQEENGVNIKHGKRHEKKVSSVLWKKWRLCPVEENLCGEKEERERKKRRMEWRKWDKKDFLDLDWISDFYSFFLSMKTREHFLSVFHTFCILMRSNFNLLYRSPFLSCINSLSSESALFVAHPLFPSLGHTLPLSSLFPSFISLSLFFFPSFFFLSFPPYSLKVLEKSYSFLISSHLMKFQGDLFIASSAKSFLPFLSFSFLLSLYLFFPSSSLILGEKYTHNLIQSISNCFPIYIVS